MAEWKEYFMELLASTEERGEETRRNVRRK